MTHHPCYSTFIFLAIILALCPTLSCSRYRDDLDYSYDVVQTWDVEHLQYGQIVQFESVFWEPDDTASLRKLIVDDAICTGRDVLEIGTGTGLIAVFCAQHNASKVIATEINPAAVANAQYNAAMLAEGLDVEVRAVEKDDPSAFSVIKPGEKFDLIISNPPWEDGQVSKPAEHAFYDPGFKLMDSLLDGLPKHLQLGGRCLLAYGHKPAVVRLEAEANRRGYQFKILDDRKLEDLEDDFLPGMLVEIRMPLNSNTPVAKVQRDDSPSTGTSNAGGSDKGKTSNSRIDQKTEPSVSNSTRPNQDSEEVEPSK